MIYHHDFLHERKEILNAGTRILMLYMMAIRNEFSHKVSVMLDNF